MTNAARRSFNDRALQIIAGLMFTASAIDGSKQARVPPPVPVMSAKQAPDPVPARPVPEPPCVAKERSVHIEAANATTSDGIKVSFSLDATLSKEARWWGCAKEATDALMGTIVVDGVQQAISHHRLIDLDGDGGIGRTVRKLGARRKAPVLLTLEPPHTNTYRDFLGEIRREFDGSFSRLAPVTGYPAEAFDVEFSGGVKTVMERGDLRALYARKQDFEARKARACPDRKAWCELDVF
jgi:hypothetical protein